MENLTNEDTISPAQENGDENKIAELSKKGYALIKENKMHEAKEAFKNILALDTNNNYALVGLGDAERKENRFNEAAAYYSRCLIRSCRLL